MWRRIPFALSAALAQSRNNYSRECAGDDPSHSRCMVPTMPPKRLRWLLPTGEALSPDLCRSWFARYPNIPMLNAYGPAECADDVAYHRIEAAPEAEIFVMPIGRPVANLRLYILDRCMELAPAGVTRRIICGGHGRRPGLCQATRSDGGGVLARPLRFARRPDCIERATWRAIAMMGRLNFMAAPMIR